MLKQLIEKGANVDGKPSNDKWKPQQHSPLLAVCEQRYEESIQALLSAGADLNVRDENERTALHNAASWWQLDESCVATARALVDAGADVNDRDKTDETPLHRAAERGTVAMLLEKGADPNAINTTGATPLHHAAKRRQPHIARLLVHAGANVNAVDNDGTIPLRLLLNNNVNERNALLFAKFITLLLEKGATPPQNDGTCGVQLATCAAFRNNAALLERYISSGDTVSANKAGSVLRLALENGSIDILRVLISHLQNHTAAYSLFVKAIEDSQYD